MRREAGIADKSPCRAEAIEGAKRGGAEKARRTAEADATRSEGGAQRAASWETVPTGTFDRHDLAG